ncbi:beta strand repeat-containing protein [Chitinophagaceae bacterium MMS25-I14]
MKKPVLILIVCLLAGFMSAGQSSVVNPKGTKIGIDTSKWKLSGNDIYTKNSGNVGIGITTPLYKLDVNAASNPLRIIGLQAGTSADSILTVQNGVVRYASVSRFITDTSIYKYDGTLTSNRVLTQGGKTLTFATGGSALNITGLTSGATTDSIVTVNPLNGQLRSVSINKLITDTSIYKYDGTLTANRTLTQGGNTLTFATGGSALNISGLTSGAVTDSLLTINPATNRVNRIATSQLNKSDSTTASNGITLTGKDVRLGGNLTQATTITNNTNALTFATGGSALNITGLTSGAATDSIVTINPSNGQLRNVSISKLITDTSIYKYDGTLTSNRVLTQGGKTLTFATGGTALNITGLTSGATTDSIVTVNPANGQLRSVAINKLVTDTSIYKYDGTLTSNRVLTQGGKTLTFATGGTALNITGLASGAATDSIVTVNPANGQLRSVAINKLITDTSIYKYDGALTSNRTLTQGGNTLTFATGGSALNISGLTSGALTDSLLTINPATNRINRIATSQLNKNDSTTASNGITLTGKDVRLGGNLTQATIITNNSNALTFATGGSALNITGLTSGAATDSIVTVNPANGQLRSVAISKLVTDTSIYKYDGTLTSNRTLTQGGKTLTFATGGTALNITGLTSGAATDSIVTVNPASGQLRSVAINRLITDTSIYKYDGTLSGNRTVTMGNNNLTFSSSGGDLIFSPSGSANVGIGTASPNTTALVDITSTTAGILVPRMTTTQRTAISSPANGLLVYDITTSCFWVYKSTLWVQIISGAPSLNPNNSGTAYVANYTLQASDNGSILEFNSASGITLTVPSGLPLGFQCSITQLGAGTVTVAAGTGVTLKNAYNYTKTAAQYSKIGVEITSTGIAILSGDAQ